MSSMLPFWDENIELEIVPWMPYGKDFSPVTINKMYSNVLGQIAAYALELDSEFLYMSGLQSGVVGTLARENIIDPVGDKYKKLTEFGFTMVFACSDQLEKAIIPLLVNLRGVKAGITICGIVSGNVLVNECKVILINSENPFFDEEKFLSLLAKSFRKRAELSQTGNAVSFFAEKFGYRRFSISYETEDLTQLRISQMLFDFELDETRELVGPAPELKLPVLDVKTPQQ